MISSKEFKRTNELDTITNSLSIDVDSICIKGNDFEITLDAEKLPYFIINTNTIIINGIKFTKQN